MKTIIPVQGGFLARVRGESRHIASGCVLLHTLGARGLGRSPPIERTPMYSSFKTFAALALAGIVLAHAGTASAARGYHRYQEQPSVKAQVPKIVKPQICKNSISRSFGGYTAKKCN